MISQIIYFLLSCHFEFCLYIQYVSGCCVGCNDCSLLLPMNFQKQSSCLTYRCLSPTRVKNPYTDEVFYTSCGHCVACLNNKASVYTSRVINETKQNKYSFFFTLTYSNRYVPRIIPSVQTYRFANGMEIPKMFVSSNPDYFDGLSYRVAFAKDFNPEKKFIMPALVDDVLQLEADDVPITGCLSRSDVQKFIKRLRININRDYGKNETFRYFITSEYGPNTFRPHYHGILFTDSDKIAESIEQLISKSWPFDNPRRHKISLVGKGAGKYVASYCNSFVDLPQILLHPSFRPFVLQSKNPLIGYKAENRKTIAKRVASGDFEEFRVADGDGSIIRDTFPKQVVSKYFNQFPFSFGLSHDDRVLLCKQSTWQRFFNGEKEALPLAFRNRLFRSITQEHYEKCCLSRVYGASLGRLLHDFHYEIYRAYRNTQINVRYLYRHYNMPLDYSNYVHLLDSIDTKYFSIQMRKFYEQQDNYINAYPDYSLARFYPNLIDMLPSSINGMNKDTWCYMKEGVIYLPSLFGDNIVLPSEIYGVSGHLDKAKLHEVFFPKDEPYFKQKEDSVNKFNFRSQLKKHNDSKYHLDDVTLYDSLNEFNPYN